MATVVFAICAVTSIAVGVLLWRGWRQSRAPLLLWTGLGFAGLALNNILLFVDEIVVPNRDLQLLRDLSSLGALSVLLFGLIWDKREVQR